MSTLTLPDEKIVAKRDIDLLETYLDCDARKGWNEAAQALAAQGSSDLLLGEFGNDADTERVW